MGSSALSLPSVERAINDGSKDGYSSREERGESHREREPKEGRDKDRLRDREGSDRATPRISRKVSY